MTDGSRHVIRIAIGVAALALLAACATAPPVSPGVRAEQKDGNRARTVTPTWESNSYIEIGGSI
ncbi:MAG: hypothetical protein ACRET6_07750 [Burkholderiales bacterium]